MRAGYKVAVRLWLACALGAATFASGCFDVDRPTCSFVCGTGSLCPEEYECRKDGYCHLQGSTEACSFSDASVVADLSVPDLTIVDLSPNTDANPADASPDL